MRRRGPFDLCRTVLAACALYALLLQGFLGAAMPASAASPLGIGCGRDLADAPRPDAPAGHDHGCCLAACTATSGALPPVGLGILVRSGRDATAIRWQARRATPGAGPFRLSLHARGPPLA